VNDLRDTCEPDGAADRAARAARTLAAIAHDAARKHVKRDVVTPKSHGADIDPMARKARGHVWAGGHDFTDPLDTAEAERQARLRRWQTPPLSNRKGG
jgi:hypothetical protein